MPERIGYYSPQTAKLVLEVVNELRRSGFVTKAGQQPQNALFETHGLAAVTPPEGIPAMSGDVPGVASCSVYRIDRTQTPAKWIAMNNAEGNQISVDVYNIASGAIGGSRRITAKKIFGSWVADMEDCS